VAHAKIPGNGDFFRPLIVRLVANLREIATGRARHAGFSIPLTG
jgi:hypothetical protein